jgi:hypothetical protein
VIASPHERAPAIRVDPCDERAAKSDQITVIDAAVVKLVGEVAEDAWPLLPSWRDWGGDLHVPFDDLDRREAGGRCSGLLPGALPAGW